MAIDKTETGWAKEIHAAEQARDNRCRVARGLVQKMHTACFHSAYELDQLYFEGDPVNYVYQFIHTIGPQLVFSNPQVRVTSRRTGLMEALAAANKQCVNRWINDKRLYRILREVVVDSFFPFGVLGIFQGSDPWPYPKRIAQEDFIRDPYALTKDGMRFTGHRWWADKDELLDRAEKHPEEEWDVGVLRSITEDSGTVGDLKHRLRGNDRDVPKRGEMVFYDIVEHGVVMDGYDPEKFPSTIYTLAVEGGVDEGRMREVRKPRPFYGRGPSPYHIYDYGYVPNDTYGLSPIVANFGQAQALNDFWRGTLSAIENYKNLIAVNSSDPDFAAKVRDLGDLSILEVSGTTREDITPFSVGGISEQHIVTLDALQKLLDENIGLSEAQRGVVPQQGTATASQIAASSSSIRVDDMEQQIYETTSDALADVLFYCWDNEDLEVPLGREAIEEMEQVPMLKAKIDAMREASVLERMQGDPSFEAQVRAAVEAGRLEDIPRPEIDIIYQGGDADYAPQGATFRDLELMVQPYSMRRTNEDLSQRRALEMLQVVAQVTQLRAAAPDGANWAELVQALGDQMNHPGLTSILEGPQRGGKGQPSGVQQPHRGPSTGAQTPLVGQSTGAELGAAARG